MLWAAGLFLGGLFIRFYNLLDQAVAHNVLLGQAHLGNALDVAQDMQRCRSGPLPDLIRQIDLGHVAGDNDLAADAHAR